MVTASDRRRSTCVVRSGWCGKTPSDQRHPKTNRGPLSSDQGADFVSNLTYSSRHASLQPPTRARRRISPGTAPAGGAPASTVVWSGAVLADRASAARVDATKRPRQDASQRRTRHREARRSTAVAAAARATAACRTQCAKHSPRRPAVARPAARGAARATTAATPAASAVAAAVFARPRRLRLDCLCFVRMDVTG